MNYRKAIAIGFSRRIGKMHIRIACYPSHEWDGNELKKLIAVGFSQRIEISYPSHEWDGNEAQDAIVQTI
ncbi:hypothetical protein [Mucilaginibacter sp. 44-25]|uniref:hypothetical protein n=1 Tax=Mucilaginibacter sp. 44-25 TaxID=1895794 RepID=UPI0025CF5EAB|nr:hypothetical protein [Mucilaginibacter sp. 44-25]